MDTITRSLGSRATSPARPELTPLPHSTCWQALATANPPVPGECPRLPLGTRLMTGGVWTRLMHRPTPPPGVRGAGPVLRLLREQSGQTQREIARIVGVSEKTVRTWERGAHGVSHHRLPRLAVALGVSVEAVLDALDGARPEAA